MRDLYQASNLVEAQLLVDRLKELGIRTVIRNSELQGALGELPMTVRPVVTVLLDSDWDAAQRETEQFEAANLLPEGPEQTCASCGDHSPSNFQVCWRCREPFVQH